MEHSPWRTTDETMAYFRVKKPTLRRWTRLGAPHLKAGRLVRFNFAQVQRWLEQRQAEKVTKSAA